jgi:hypothetical protein
MIAIYLTSYQGASKIIINYLRFKIWYLFLYKIFFVNIQYNTMLFIILELFMNVFILRII